MSNTLDILQHQLDVALSDPDHASWGDDEKQLLVKQAVADLYPKLKRELDPTATTITLVDSTYWYSLPTGVREVFRVDWLDTSGNELGPIDDLAWELGGDVYAGSGKIHVATTIVDSGGTLQLHGYGRFDTTTNLIPDEFVPIVLAKARAEAYRRLAGSRARYKQWLALNQVQNVTVNELILLINEADREAQTLMKAHRTMSKPVPGRQ